MKAKIILVISALALCGVAMAAPRAPAAAPSASTTALVAAADRSCRAPPATFSSPPVAATPPPASLWRGRHYGHSVTLTATPATVLVDQPISVRVAGLPPGAPVTIHASMKLPTLYQSANGVEAMKWESSATFFANKEGVVKVARSTPRYGSYAGVHAMGLVWSMMPEGAKKPATAWPFLPQAGAELSLTATANGRTLARAQVLRLSRSPKVKERKLDSDGLAGILFTPAKPGAHPAVIVLGGSEGGLQPQVLEAALLASHGYIALGLAYFQGYASKNPMLAKLPKQLVKIPLEYFKHAAKWLQKQPGVKAHHIGILGWSKGAEAALLVASTYPKIFHAVVAYAPGSETWSGIHRGPPVASWTLKGKPVPFVTFDANTNFFNRKTMTLDLRPGYLKPIVKGGKQVARAAIPAWRISGPVLLLSGTDDQIWPSSLFAARIMKRLGKHHHDYPDESLCYRGAGHFVALWPYRPTVTTAVQEGPVTMLLGGNQLAYAYSDANSWPKVLAFLNHALH